MESNRTRLERIGFDHASASGAFGKQIEHVASRRHAERRRRLPAAPANAVRAPPPMLGGFEAKFTQNAGNVRASCNSLAAHRHHAWKISRLRAVSPRVWADLEIIAPGSGSSRLGV
jgi:hypothetical protein